MIHYTDRVLWYCDVCGDEGEADSDSGARYEAENHECNEGEFL